MTDLNKEQAAAAAHGEGPLLVVSGPGCGKTSTLVRRYVNLLKAGIKPEQILSITFTRKAARQMSRGIARETGLRSDRMAVGTFHSIALAIMRNYQKAFGDLAERRVLTEAEPERIVSRIARDLDISTDGLVEAIERFKDELTTPSDALRAARDVEGVERHEAERKARVYGAYQRYLKENAVMDFGDIVMAVVQKMRSDPKLLRTLRARFLFVMIDEYQDVNPAQDMLVRLLAGERRNVWAVGDPDQAIFGFRGSDVRFILNFQRAYPGAGRVELVRNYRSSGVVVQAANKLIANNRQRFGKELVAARTAAREPALSLHEAATPRDEADWIAARIAEIAAAGVSYPEMAILVRVAHHANWIEQALARAGVPFTLLGVTNFWTLPEVKQALRAIAAATGADVAPDDHPPSPWLLEEVRREDKQAGFHAVASRICKAVGRRPPKGIAGQRREAWQSATGLLASEIAQMTDADAFEDRVASRESLGDRGEDGGVHIGTIHAAKGLEWDAVFVAACEEGVLPHAKNADVEEERRLAFVAVTRARLHCALSWTRERGRNEAQPSRFVEELAQGLPAKSVARSSGGF